MLALHSDSFRKFKSKIILTKNRLDFVLDESEYLIYFWSFIKDGLTIAHLLCETAQNPRAGFAMDLDQV